MNVQNVSRNRNDMVYRMIIWKKNFVIIEKYVFIQSLSKSIEHDDVKRRCHALIERVVNM